MTTPQDKMQSQVLVKLHSTFIEKLLQKVTGTVATLLAQEQYQQHEATNDEEFTYSVEKFEFELFDHFKTNKVMKSYPISLPYSKSVVEINYALTGFLERNLDYWQFLLQSSGDFGLVSSSCDRIFTAAVEQI